MTASLHDLSYQYYSGVANELHNAIGLSKIPGVRRILLSGNNPDVQTGTLPEDIWQGGGVYPIITAPLSLEIVSSSASDTAAGTGARTLIVMVLDSSYNEVTLTLTLNGTTAVAFPQTVVAINNMIVMTAGSNEANVGTLTVRDAGGGTTRDVMIPNSAQNRKAIYTVPAGYTLNFYKLISTLNRTAGTSTNYMTIQLGVRSILGVKRTPLELGVSSLTPGILEINPGAMIQEKETLFVRCIDTSVTSNITVACVGLLTKN